VDVGFVGIDFFSLEATTAVVELNLVTGAPAGASVVDFSQFEGGAYLVNTGNGDIGLAYETRLIRAAADNVLLRVSEFLYLEASVAFEMGSTRQVTINTGISANIGALAEDSLGGLRSALGSLQSSLLQLTADVENLIESALTTLKTTVIDSIDGVITKIADAIGASFESAAGSVFTDLEGALAGLSDSAAVESLIDDLLGGLTDQLPESLAGIAQKLIDPAKDLLVERFQSVIASGLETVLEQLKSSLSGALENATQAAQDKVREVIETYLDPVLARILAKIDGLVGRVEMLLAPVMQKLESIAAIEIGENFTTIENLDVSVMTVGVGNGNFFIGLANNGGPDFSRPLSEQDLVGFGLQDLNLGFAMFTPTLSKSFPTFMAAKASAGSFAFVLGGPESDLFRLTADQIQFAMNTGGPLISGAASLGIATIDFSSFVETDTDLNGNGVIDPGFRVETDASGNNPVYLDFTGNVIEASVSNAQFSLFDFIHLNGNFAFSKGARSTVTINTGISSDVGSLVESTGLTQVLSDLELGGVSVSEDLTTITGLEVEALSIGASNVSAYIGVGTPDFSQPLVDQSDLTGFGLEDLNLALSFFKSTLPIGGLPTFTAMKASVGRVGLVGMGDILDIYAQDIELIVNRGTKWFGVIGPPAIDFGASFPGDN
jgi:hypothetical protein